MNDKNSLPILIVALVAGFLAVLVFHQPMLILLKNIGLAADNLTPYATNPTPPFGIPRVLSLALWGGVWGILLAIAISGTQGLAYWLSGLLLGAIVPSLVNWFIVLPLKDEPVGGGWQVPGVATALIVNGVWGIGTVLLFRLLARNLLSNNRRN
ncbi:hypothetical protein [Pleurocapsa sp. FMAR1]|uniref:hypothetical protein n=1 Tax=Pleurocapsa sp. FMAR1 TaxID=3040204 RepID=UPI0029C65849|nr:hypothetical protein [Pleurocapsa sp. FMAR1]